MMNLNGADMQIQELQDRLVTVTADRDALALELAHLRPEWQAVTAERDTLRAQLAAATKPPSTGVWMHTDKYHELLASIDRYGADQWRRGAGNKDLQEFAEWQREI